MQRNYSKRFMKKKIWTLENGMRPPASILRPLNGCFMLNFFFTTYEIATGNIITFDETQSRVLYSFESEMSLLCVLAIDSWFAKTLIYTYW